MQGHGVHVRAARDPAASGADDVAEVAPTEAERIAYAYLTASAGRGWPAVLSAVEDAIADLLEAERRTLRRDRLISRGYVRGRV